MMNAWGKGSAETKGRMARHSARLKHKLPLGGHLASHAMHGANQAPQCVLMRASNAVMGWLRQSCNC